MGFFCCLSGCLQSWVTPAKGSLACGEHNELCVWCFILLTESWLICRCTGFIFQKVGKLAATAVGGGFFLLQVCMNSSPGFLRTLLLGTEVSLGTTASWDMWGQSPLCQGLCVAVNVKDACSPGHMDATAEQGHKLQDCQCTSTEDLPPKAQESCYCRGT